MSPPVEEWPTCLAPSSGLLRAGVGLKLNQIKRRRGLICATAPTRRPAPSPPMPLPPGCSRRPDFSDRGLFVGTIALFRWIEINYGQFWAFGAVGALLLVIAVDLRRTGGRPSSSARRRIFLAHQPAARRDQGQSRSSRTRSRPSRDTAAAILLAPSAPPARASADGEPRPRRTTTRHMQAGLILTATLLGWAAARRRQQARRAEI